MASRVRWFAASAWLAAVAALFVGSAIADDKKSDAKVPDLHDIMDKNKGKNALHTKIAAAAKAEKWDEAQKLGKEFKALGEALGKNDPHKGSKESWAKFAKSYKEQTAAVADAADKKDAKTVEAAAMTFGKSCAGCHKEHK